MNTRQYYYLSTIANYGNLSHAAQALHVSPSALSKFLAECERTFGFALFLRYNRRLYPTAVGRYVVECAQKILDEQNRMLLTVKEVTGGNRKAIRLATAPNRGAIIFSKIYNQFSRRYPDISLSLAELYAAEQPGAIARGLVDLALGARCHQQRGHRHPHCPRRTTGVPACLPPTGKAGDHPSGRPAGHSLCIAGSPSQHPAHCRAAFPAGGVPARSRL